MQSFKNFYFFEIPVYRLSQKDYHIETEKIIFKATEVFRKRNTNENILKEICKSFSYSIPQWEFNDRIGYLKLYFLSTQLRAEYHAVKAKKIFRSKQKTFEFKTHKLCAETEIKSNLSNIEIYNLILKHLQNCQKELQNRYIDIEQFTQIAPFINWNDLLTN